MEPVALALHLDDFGVGEKAIEDGSRSRDVTEELRPVLRRAVGGDDGRGGAVTADEDLEEVLGRARTESFHAEVLEDEEVDAGELLDEIASRAGGLGLGEVRGQIEGAAHERGSTLITTNRPTEDWASFLEDVPATTAILDRFLARAEIVQMQGKSYRLQKRIEQRSSEDRP